MQEVGHRQGVFVCIALALSFLLVTASRAIGQQLPIKRYTTSDGLANNRVARIVKDSHDFLWFCTADGVARFDGVRFTTYNVEDGLPSPSVTDVLESRSGAYWFSTNGGGIARLKSLTGPRPTGEAEKRPRFTTYPVSSNPVTNRVNILFEDGRGVLWAGTDGGLFCMDEPTGEQEFHAVPLNIPSHPDLSVQIWGVVEGDEDSLWIATKFGLIHRLREGRSILYQIQPGQTGDVVFSLLKDNEGNLWLSHDAGVIVFRPRSSIEWENPDRRIVKLPADARRYTSARWLRGSHSRQLYRSSNGQIWALDAAGGLSTFDGETFQPYPTKNPILRGNTSMTEDCDGNIWIGTYGAGALRIAMQGLISYNTSDGLGSSVGSVFEGRGGEVYVSSSGWLISRFDGKRFATVRFNLPRSVYETDWRASNNVIEDRTGEWWVGTRLGLYRFPRVERFDQLATVRPKAVYTRNDGLVDDDIVNLFEDPHGDLWIGGFSAERQVLTRWERKTESFHSYSQEDGLKPFTAPTVFCEDRAGNLWIAFREGGLARYRDGRFELLPESNDLLAGTIRGLYVDRSGRLWASQARDGVLFRLDELKAPRPTLTAYTGDAGLRSHRFSCITGDSLGRIYVGNSRGIDQFDPETGHVRYYSSSDELGAGEPLAALCDREGNLWFATIKGLVRLIPRTSQAADPPSILIDQLRVAGNDYHVFELGEREISGLEMEPNQNQIQIDFFGVSFRADEELRYQYKLDGTYSDWSVPSEQRSVNYANLAPGAYRFLVRSISSSGVTSELPAVVAFRILPPVWRRWWFLALAGLLAVSVGLAIARSRIARLRAERESDRRFRTLAETASDAIITIDEESNIVLANQGTEQIFGYPIAEIMGKKLTLLMPEYLRHLHEQGLERYIATGKRHISWQAIELPGLHKNGAEIPLEIAFGEFTKGDKRFFTGIARDITERKRAEAERKQAEEALRRSREDRLAELERVRRRIATDLHDDIGSSLTQIAILSEVAHQNAGRGGAEDLIGPLTRITNVSNELVETMSDIVWAINPKKDHLSDLVHRMRRFASDIFTARRIAFRFQAIDGQRDIELGANVRREVFLIFKETINNIVKHSNCNRAEIEFQTDGEWLILKLTDDGSGFDCGHNEEGSPVSSSERGGNGIPSMRRRAQEMGGRFDIVSMKGQGTTVTLRVLVAHPDNDQHAPPDNK